MEIFNFQKPNKVNTIKSNDFEGKFELGPLELNYGLIVGNALRRVLLSSLEGYAITSIRIEGVENEFSSIFGIVEDVTEIIFNLKQMRFKRKINFIDNKIVRVSFSDKNCLTAGDFQKYMFGFHILNPDLVICNFDSKISINMELTIEKIRGYFPVETGKRQNAPFGTIFFDAIYSPVKNVKFSIENFCLEQKSDYEKLVLEIITDGSINPKDALTEAAKTLINHLIMFSDEKNPFETGEITQTESYYDEGLHIKQLLKTKLVDLGLSVRALNCLKMTEIETLGDLVSYNKNDLMKIRSFGKKSLAEIDDLVAVKGLKFGVDY